MSKMIYEILLEVRKKYKLSRKKMSDLSGFNERTIVSYENGSRKVSKEYIRFISLYFNVSENFIRALEVENKEYSPLKRTLLMYQDIYNYTDEEMGNLLNFKNSIKMYQKLLNENVFNIQTRGIVILLESLEYLNIKPSCVGLQLPSIEPIERNLERLENNFSKDGLKKYLEETQEHFEERKALLDKRILILEKKGINLNAEYYAENIKRRNLAKKNYIPVSEPVQFEKKYQKVIDLLPYASDKFLEDIHNKLKALKELQTL